MGEHRADRKCRHAGKNNTMREKNVRDQKKKGRHDLGNTEMAENVVMGGRKNTRMRRHDRQTKQHVDIETPNARKVTEKKQT